MAELVPSSDVQADGTRGTVLNVPPRVRADRALGEDPPGLSCPEISVGVRSRARSLARGS